MVLQPPLCPASSNSGVDVDREAKPLTNDQICDLIADKVAHYRSKLLSLSSKRSINESNRLLQTDCTLPVSLTKTLSCGKDRHREQIHGCFPVQQNRPELLHRQDRIRRGTFFPEGAPESERTERTQPSEGPASCGAGEVICEVSTAISAFSCEEALKNNLCLIVCTSNQKYETELNGNKFSYGRSEVLDGSYALEPEEKKESRKKESVDMNRVSDSPPSDKTTKTRDHQDSYPKSQCSVPKPSPEEKEPDVPVSTATNQTGNQSRSGSLTLIKDPQYDDISDLENESELTSSLPQSNLCEDVSGGETIADVAITPPVEEATPVRNKDAPVHSPNNYVPPQTDAPGETQWCRSQRDLDWPKKSSSPGTVLTDDETIQETDDEEDGDWVVLHVSVFKVEFEQGEEQQDSLKERPNDVEHRVIQSNSYSGSSKARANPVPASAFSHMEVFDTPTEQEESVKFGQLSIVVPLCSDQEQFCGALTNSIVLDSEPEDSCDTEDSFDYSSGPDCNYLTVSQKLFKNLSSPSKQSRAHDKASSPSRKGQTRRKTKCSADEVINLDSDEDSEDSGGKDDTEELGTPSRCSLAQEVHSASSDFITNQNKSFKPASLTDESIIILSDSDDYDEGNNAAPENASSVSVDSPKAPQHSPSRTVRDGGHVSPESVHFPKLPKKRSVLSSESEDSDGLTQGEAGPSLSTVKKFKKASSCAKPHQESSSGLCLGWDASAGADPDIPQRFVHPSANGAHKRPEALNSSAGKGEQSSCRPTKKPSFRDDGGKNPFSGSGRAADKKSHSSCRLDIKVPSQSSRTRTDCRTAAVTYVSPMKSSAKTPSVPRSTHARSKVFHGWQEKHVPLRREKKRWKRLKRL